MTTVSFGLDKDNNLTKTVHISKTISNTSIVDDEQAALAPVYSDTGLLPVSGTGLLQLRRFRDTYQFVYQIEPCISRIYVNGNRNQNIPFLSHKNSKWFEVSQPYIVIIGEILATKDRYQLVGARHFYSPESIIHLDQQLYHTNLPNTNAMFYGESGLGWVCLYQQEDPADFNACLKKAIARVRGGEGYNANMSSIDGAALYWRYNTHPGFVTPVAWSEYTKEDPDFVMKEENLLPISVYGINADTVLANTDIMKGLDLESNRQYSQRQAFLQERVWLYMAKINGGPSKFNKADYFSGMAGIPYTIGAAIYGAGHNYYGHPDPVSKYFQKAHPEYFKDLDLGHLDANPVDNLFGEMTPTLLHDLVEYTSKKNIESSPFRRHIAPPLSVTKPKAMDKPYAKQKCVITDKILGNELAVPYKDGYALASIIEDHAVHSNHLNKWIAIEDAVYSSIDNDWYDEKTIAKLGQCCICKSYTKGSMTFKLCTECYRSTQKLLANHNIYQQIKPSTIYEVLGIERTTKAVPRRLAPRYVNTNDTFTKKVDFDDDF